MSTPPAARFPWLMAAGIFVLAVVGVGFLSLAIYTLTRPNTPAVATDLPTLAFTSAAAIPTTTPAPPTNTPEPTAAPTDPPTEAPPTEPVATAVALRTNIVLPANVRSGPGLNYPILGGLNTGDTADLLGRDASAQWYAISYALGPNGIGWVSNLVATVEGDAQVLPVLTAEAPPPPGATSAPTSAATNPPAATSAPQPTATSAPQGARGIVANSFSVENASAAVGQDVWFNFEVKNTSQSAVGYGVLAAHTDVGVTAQSWTNESLDPGEVLAWRDHINFSAAGTYQLYLGICFSGRDACLAGAAWDRLSNFFTITIQ